MKKYIALLLAAVMMLAAFTGCGSKTEEPAAPAETTTAPAETTTTPAETEKAPMKVVIGTTGSGLPYSLMDDNGNWDGVEAAVWKIIQERYGWEVEVKTIPGMANLFGELEAGRIQVVANCGAITAARLEKYICCDPLYADAQNVIVNEGSDVTALDQLKGKSLGVTAGQAAQDTVEGLTDTYGWEVIAYEDSAAGFQDLALGRLDAYANTTTNIEKMMYSQGYKFNYVGDPLFGNNVSWWLRDDEESMAVRDALNEIIAELHADGSLSKICEEYFYNDQTKLISNDWLHATK
ncbi:MAG: transporter substrate-binding domain-containing protein [Firmicutes bacterium]|nr:transporter substrate-binding domain-containing protein [Bacillota bacterium]